MCMVVTETFEPHHDKTNKVACVLSDDSDQPGHPQSFCWFCHEAAHFSCFLGVLIHVVS